MAGLFWPLTLSLNTQLEEFWEEVPSLMALTDHTYKPTQNNPAIVKWLLDLTCYTIAMAFVGIVTPG